MRQNVDGAEPSRRVRSLSLLFRPRPELGNDAAELFMAHSPGASQAQSVVFWVAPVGVEEIDTGEVDADVPVSRLGRCCRVQGVVIAERLTSFD